MNQRGRKSAAALAVVTQDQTAVTPLMPPPGLSQAERGVWMLTVNSKPVDWFGIEHGPLLVEYVRHVCRSHVVDEQMKAFDAEWLATDEGLKRYEKLAGVATKIAGVIKALATSMRLTQHAVYHKDKAGMGPGKGRKIWQREPS